MHEVPTPQVVITYNESLTVGSNTTLVCTVDGYNDIGHNLSVNITWSRSETVLFDHHERVIISEVFESQSNFISKLTPSPLSAEDANITCDVSDADNVRPDIKYLWWHHNGSDTKMTEINSRSLSFLPLKLSDAGQYMCQVNISSTLLGSDLILSSIPPHVTRVFGKFIANSLMLTAC